MVSFNPPDPPVHDEPSDEEKHQTAERLCDEYHPDTGEYESRIEVTEEQLGRLNSRLYVRTRSEFSVQENSDGAVLIHRTDNPGAFVQAQDLIGEVFHESAQT